MPASVNEESHLCIFRACMVVAEALLILIDSLLLFCGEEFHNTWYQNGTLPLIIERSGFFTAFVA